MKLWAEFHPYVLPDVTGCPEPLLDQALRETARDFCKRTKAWREWGDPISAYAGQIEIDLGTATYTEVVAITAASIDGKDLTVLGSQALPSGWQSGEQGNVKDNTLVMLNSKQCVVFPQPADGEAIAVQYALRPTMAGIGVGDVIFEEHAEAIAAGAKAKLMSKPGKPWTDLQSAAMYGMEFERRLNLAANTDWHQSAQRRTSRVGI